jgi:hypothetical protein
MIKFNNLNYDNHICYARIRGDSLDDLFIKGQNLINAPNRTLTEAIKCNFDNAFFRKELPKE